MTKVLGVDYGTKRIGLALSSEDGRYAFPYRTVPAEPLTGALGTVAAACRSEGVGSVVVGLPLDQHGAEGDAAASVRTFGEQLRALVGLPVSYVDERFSSAQAHTQARQAGAPTRATRLTLDQTAAQLILQSYLDRTYGT